MEYYLEGNVLINTKDEVLALFQPLAKFTLSSTSDWISPCNSRKEALMTGTGACAGMRDCA